MLKLGIMHEMLNNLNSFLLGHLVDLSQKHKLWFYSKQSHDRLTVVLNAIDQDPLEFSVILWEWELLQELKALDLVHLLLLHDLLLDLF